MGKRASESELLAHIFDRTRGLKSRFRHVIAGPGHDCAVVRVGTRPILLKVDQLIEGRHFVAGTPLKLIARKAMARAISDIAASGGSPLCALIAAAVPADFADADALFDLVHAAALDFACPVVGGDISGTAGPLSLSVSIVGLPHPRRGAVLRDGARPGDLLYVTGTLGRSFDARTGRGRHLTFTPRLAEARHLCDRLGRNLHAMMDLSDGLGRDAGRMAKMSRVSMVLEAKALPMSRGVKDWRHAAGDGEDYELFFAAAPRAHVPLDVCGTPVRCIGRVVKGAGQAWMADGENRVECSELGWEH